MPKSEFAKHLDAVQASVAAFLKPLGFRKKGRTHNRTTAGELVHVVNFQMGEYPVGEHYIIPGLRESFYGKFAVNLGVLLPCVREVEWQKPAPEFVQEHYCTIRSRLGSLAFGADHWFDLTSDTFTLATSLVELFDKFGLPFFEQFPDYPAVLAYFDSHGDLPFQNSGRAALEVAIVARHLGDMQRAQRLLAKAHSTDHKGFREHVSTLASRLGHQVA
jgi:hypothetical protein